MSGRIEIAPGPASLLFPVKAGYLLMFEHFCYAASGTGDAAGDA